MAQMLQIDTGRGKQVRQQTGGENCSMSVNATFVLFQSPWGGERYAGSSLARRGEERWLRGAVSCKG